MKDLTQLLSVSYRRTKTFYTEKLQTLGITSGQFIYIVAVCENPGMTQDDLAKQLILDKGTVANALPALEKNGFILKKANAEDKRKCNLFPTPKAQSVYPEILKQKDEWNSRLTAGLSDIERDVLEKLLEKLMLNAIQNCRN